MFNLAQKTINNSINCNSVGLHSGLNINMKINPAPINTGIIFRRIDLESGKNEIKADFKNVTTTNLGTSIANEFGASISTIEHLMAAIWRILCTSLNWRSDRKLKQFSILRDKKLFEFFYLFAKNKIFKVGGDLERVIQMEDVLGGFELYGANKNKVDKERSTVPMFMYT